MANKAPRRMIYQPFFSPMAFSFPIIDIIAVYATETFSAVALSMYLLQHYNVLHGITHCRLGRQRVKFIP